MKTLAIATLAVLAICGTAEAQGRKIPNNAGGPPLNACTTGEMSYDRSTVVHYRNLRDCLSGADSESKSLRCDNYQSRECAQAQNQVYNNKAAMCQRTCS